MSKLYTIVDGLSPRGREVLHQAVREKWTAERTVQAIADETGEAVKERTIARHLANLRGDAERRAAARERMQDLVAALQSGNASAADMVQALAMQTLENDPDALTSEDPLKLQRLGLAAQELRVKERALLVKERGIAAVERRLAMAEEKERRLVDAAQEPGMTDAERNEKVRSILGLSV